MKLNNTNISGSSSSASSLSSISLSSTGSSTGSATPTPPPGPPGPSSSSSSTMSSTCTYPFLVLKSPHSSTPITYNWPLFTESGREGLNGASELFETIRLFSSTYPSLGTSQLVSSPDVDPNSYDSLARLCTQFNDLIGKASSTQIIPPSRTKPSPALLKHIISQTYNFVVTAPKTLNGYIPFSPNVYGETSFDLVTQMIDQLEIGQKDVFIDLGSGVGQVVLQMAAGTDCRMCYGIEKADVPAQYAEEMNLRFRTLMKWYGQKHGEYKIVKGDFLDSKHLDLLKESTIIFVNNYAFGPKVDHELKLRFADLNNGVRIVSSKAFCPLNFRITQRNLSDIAAIMHIRELLNPMKGSVSWTDKPVSYFLHEIDTSKLERYFENKAREYSGYGGGGNGSNDRKPGRRRRAPNAINRQKNQKDNQLIVVVPGPHAGADNSSSSSSSTSSTEIGNPGSDGENNPSGAVGAGAGGPTTRKAWSDWCDRSNGGADFDEMDNTNTNSNGIMSMSSASAKKNDKKKLVGKGKGNRTKSRRSNTLKRRQLKRKKAPAKLINGLELLHSETILSTTTNMAPLAPGCVDTHLTTLSLHNKHTELSIPSKPDTPYALQKLLDIYRIQFIEMIESMKKPEYKQMLVDQIDFQRNRREYLVKRQEMLESSIKELTKTSVDLLKEKLKDLGIDMGEGDGADRLLSEARSIVLHHKSLQSTAQKIQSEINSLESILNHKVNLYREQILENHRTRAGPGNNLNYSDPAILDGIVRQEIILELNGVLSRREELEKKSREERLRIEELENSNKKLINSGAVVVATGSRRQDENPQQIQQRKNNPRDRSASFSTTSTPSNPPNWPSIPPIPKIHENNPEVLARKILDSCRRTEEASARMNSKKSPAAAAPSPALPATPPTGGRKTWNSRFAIPTTTASNDHQHQSPPKVSFFEDGVKNIIESMLNEGNGSGNNGAKSHIPQAQSSTRTSPNKNNNQQQTTSRSSSFSSSNNQNQPAPTPGRLALRLHFEKSSNSDKQQNQSNSNNTTHGQSQTQKPLTIQDLVSGEIERSLNRQQPQQQSQSPSARTTTPINYPSPPVADIYRPIETQSGAHGQGPATNYNRASVLVTTSKTSSPGAGTMSEGLHARMMCAMGSNSKSPIAAPPAELDIIRKETKLVDDKVSGGGKIKTTQVLIGGGSTSTSGDPRDMDSNSNNNSVLRVSKKRILPADEQETVSTTMTSPSGNSSSSPSIQHQQQGPPNPKKKALSLISSMNQNNNNNDHSSHHPPATPSPKLLVTSNLSQQNQQQKNSNIENQTDESQSDPLLPSNSRPQMQNVISATSTPTPPPQQIPISQWQSTISSKFDKLICFANEINDKKRRKSLENMSPGAATTTSSIIKVEQISDGEDVGDDDDGPPKTPNFKSQSCASGSNAYPDRPPRTPSPSHAHEIDDDELELNDGDFSSSASNQPIKSELHLHHHRQSHQHQLHHHHSSTTTTTTIDIDPLGLACGGSSLLIGLDEPPPTPGNCGMGIGDDLDVPEADSCSVKIKIEKLDDHERDNCGAEATTPMTPINNPHQMPQSGPADSQQQHFKKRWNNWGGSGSHSQNPRPSSVSSDCSSTSNSANTPQPQSQGMTDYHQPQQHNHTINNPILPKFRGKQSSWGDWAHENEIEQGHGHGPQPLPQQQQPSNNTSSPLPLIQVNVTLTHPPPPPQQAHGHGQQSMPIMDHPHGHGHPHGAKININTNPPIIPLPQPSHQQHHQYRTNQNQQQANNYHHYNNAPPPPSAQIRQHQQQHQQYNRYHAYNNGPNQFQPDHQEMRNPQSQGYGHGLAHGHGYYPPQPQPTPQNYPQQQRYHQQQQYHHHTQQRR